MNSSPKSSSASATVPSAGSAVSSGDAMRNTSMPATSTVTVLSETSRQNTGTTAKVLETMRSAGKPVSAGEVATLSGLDRKEVDKAFAQLKKDGAIVSPVRCKWQPAE